MNLSEREAAVLFHTYKRLPLEIEWAEGMYLIARDGTRYLDMFAGLAVNALGYAHPAVVKAIADQAARFTHLSNYFLQETQIRLAELITQHGGYERMFLANSGTEAIEGTIKLVRRWGSTRGKSEIVSISNAFHGRTMGALSLMDRPRYKEGFGPFLEGFRVAEFNDPESLRASIAPQTATVVLEFVQGEGGIRPVSSSFVQTMVDLHKKYGFLLVADEIQSGIGRTGKFFAFQHYEGVHPDIVVVAKPIGGGLPLGGILAHPDVANVLEPGMHGTTFGGNPVACAAGIAVIEEIIGKNLMLHASKMGGLMKKEFERLRSAFPAIIKEVRVMGLMAGIELNQEADPLVAAMREKHHILINGTDRTVLRLLPPMIVTPDQVSTTVTALEDVLEGVKG
ncbi:MAG: argD [Bacteroidetes bacterium]|nr:argD [Bacteroidota bacterium]